MTLHDVPIPGLTDHLMGEGLLGDLVASWNEMRTDNLGRRLIILIFFVLKMTKN